MGRLSIRWRLTVWYGVVLATVLAVFGGAVYLLMRRELLARTDEGIALELSEAIEVIEQAPSAPVMRAALEHEFAHHEGYEFEVADAGGAVLFRSDQLRGAGLPPPSGPVPWDRPAFRSRGRWRLAAVRVRGPAGPLVVQAAYPLAANEQELGGLLAVLLGTGPLALAGALGGGYLLARKALAPVDRMAAAADQITAARLDQRIEVPPVDDELGRLARTLNGMIARLERSFDEIRRFTADAAHELRTPLAVLRNQAEVALRAPRDPEQYRRVLENQLEEIERLTRLAEQLLFLCRGEGGLAPPARQAVAIEGLVREVAEHMQVVADARQQTLRIDAHAPGTVVGDADQLRRLLFNLLDNAIKYTPAGGEIAVTAARRDGRVEVVVADTGIGIPPEHLPHLFKRFYRVDPSRGLQAGTGLGLAICQSIAEAHDGTVRLESPGGRGTRAIVELPIRPAGRASPGSPVPRAPDGP